MRIFAATVPHVPTPRTEVPVEILRRLAFGRPERRTIQPALPIQSAAVVESLPAQLDEPCDLDQRVRQSGEW